MVRSRACRRVSLAGDTAPLPERIDRFLDLGTGDGRLLALIRSRYPDARAIGIDIAEPMLVLAEDRFNGDPLIDICTHDLDAALPPLGSFDAVVSGLAIHHLHDVRKLELIGEIHGLLVSAASSQISIS